LPSHVSGVCWRLLTGETIVCLSAVDWHGIWARPQQLMTIFARHGNRVLYVEPPITLLSPLKKPELLGRMTGRLQRGYVGRTCNWTESVEQAGESIFVYRPPAALPFGNMYRFINRLNQWILARAIKKVLNSLGWSATVWWTYLPNTVDMLPHVGFKNKAGSDLRSRDINCCHNGGKAILCYDCADEHAAFPGLVNARTVRKMELELFQRADVNLATAHELYERKKRYAPGLKLVPNGADAEHFEQALSEELPVAGEIANLPFPVVGYIGAVGSWLDMEMLAALARARPDFSIVLVGPVDTDVSPLTGFKNIYLLGKRDYRELPRYLKGFDVAVIPFKVDELTVNVNPVKLYEYLAAGRPVVSSALPEVRKFAPLVGIAENTAEFVELVSKAAAEKDPDRVLARVKTARANSWANRAGEASRQLEMHLKNEKQGIEGI